MPMLQDPAPGPKKPTPGFGSRPPTYRYDEEHSKIEDPNRRASAMARRYERDIRAILDSGWPIEEIIAALRNYLPSSDLTSVAFASEQIMEWAITNGVEEPVISMLLPYIREGTWMAVNYARPELLMDIHGPETLIALGYRAASEMRHETAFEYLKTALTLVRAQAAMLSIDRYSNFETKETRQRFAAHQRQVLSHLQRIFAIYPELARKHQRRPEMSVEYRLKGVELNDLLYKTTFQSEWARRPGAMLDDQTDIITAELYRKGRGKSFEMYGAADPAGSPELVRPLDPKDNESNSAVITATLGETVLVFSAQQRLLTAAAMMPGMTGTGAPEVDLTDMAVRTKFWTEVYSGKHSDWKRDFGLPDTGNPLADTLAVIQLYLTAFTVHSGWNISDSGVSFLKRKLPRDATGRQLQDCGVYVVQIASELAHALDANGALATVEFNIVNFPGHAMLTIYDTSKNKYYIINNAHIDGPHDGDPAPEIKGNLNDPNVKDVRQQLARHYAGATGRRSAVTPAATYKVNGGSAAEFDANLWHRYTSVTQSWDFKRGIPIATVDGPVALDYDEFFNQSKYYDETWDALGRKTKTWIKDGGIDASNMTTIKFVFETFVDAAYMTGVFNAFGPASRSTTMDFANTKSGRDAEAWTENRTYWVDVGQGIHPLVGYVPALEKFITLIPDPNKQKQEFEGLAAALHRELSQDGNSMSLAQVEGALDVFRGTAPGTLQDIKTRVLPYVVQQ